MKKLEKDVFNEIKKFGDYPQLIHKKIELVRKGLSHIKSTFLLN